MEITRKPTKAEYNARIQRAKQRIERRRLGLSTDAIYNGVNLTKLMEDMPRSNLSGKLPDENYYCECLNCGRIVLCGPKCCDNFKSQAMVDEENGNAVIE